MTEKHYLTCDNTCREHLSGSAAFDSTVSEVVCECPVDQLVSQYQASCAYQRPALRVHYDSPETVCIVRFELVFCFTGIYNLLILK